jgi:hypothetical protein
MCEISGIFFHIFPNYIGKNSRPKFEIYLASPKFSGRPWVRLQFGKACASECLKDDQGRVQFEVFEKLTSVCLSQLHGRETVMYILLINNARKNYFIVTYMHETDADK